ncbi:hypothetical protein IH979_03340 [Patescibacteria group bacterium]|nr:hypothetical protein [Patescibacteria group bacterium]
MLIEAEGETGAVDEFLRRAREGSDMAIIKRIIVKEGPMKDLIGFRVKY